LWLVRALGKGGRLRGCRRMGNARVKTRGLL
jgi:hypothetical protein